ncbi:hypothetical protein ACRYCC_26035 [Actinomadura scrupuli]|uniref:hypothetical protein n=1 Tax=Actinomadura scrupuli TaxID=559629 RepID=UPI003D95575E
MTIFWYLVNGTVVGLVIGIVGAWRGRVVAAVVYDVAHRTVVIAVAVGKRVAVAFARPRGHHTERWLKTYEDAGDTQAFQQVSAT